MKHSIYLYLQRYLVKVLTKSCTYEKYHSALAPHLLNMVKTQEGVDLLTLNFFKNCYIKKSVGLNLDFSLLSYIYLVNQTSFFKKSQKHSFYFFFFVKNSNINCSSPIKSTTLIKEAKYLYKKNFDGNSSSFQIVNFRTLKKNAKLIFQFTPELCYHKQVMFFYFQKEKKRNFLIFLKAKRCKITKINFFSLLTSFFKLSLFLSQQLSLNKKSNMIYLNSFCFITFPFKHVTQSFRRSTNGAFLCNESLICVANLLFLTFKYVKKKKFIQIIDYKVFVYLVNKFNFFLFPSKNLTQVETNSFQSQTVLITTAVNSYFFVLRPLFSLTRLDTFYICESLKLPIYPDQSNFRVDFLRNRIRKQILPAIRVLLNPQFDTILCKFNEV